MFNFDPSTLQYLSGATTTLLGAVVVHWLTIRRDKMKDKQHRKAIRMLFVSVIVNYANHRHDGLSWSNSFWNEHQFDIALYFPEEVFRFSAILENGNEPDSFRYHRFSTDQEEALKLANKLLQSVESKPHFQRLKDKITNWLTKKDWW